MSKHRTSQQSKAKSPHICINNREKQYSKIQQPLVIGETNKHVLGGYFSLGLNNFYTAVLSIFAKIGIKVANENGVVLYSEEKIGVVLRTLYKTVSNEKCNTQEELAYATQLKLNSLQQTKLHKLLFHHFPMLGPIMANEAAHKVSKSKKSNVTDAYTMTYGVTLSECLDVISTIAQGLVDCRNAHVHYSPYNDKKSLEEQYTLQSKIVCYLDKTFAASRRLDKDRNNIDTTMMEFLTGCAKGGKLQDYIDKFGYTPKYDEEEVVENGRKTKKYKERDDFFYKIGQNIEGVQHTILSGFGLCYFCAIFLSKSQAKQLLSDIELFKESTYSKDCNDIIRDIMSIYRIRSPRGKKKFESSNDKTTLALDILNELRKCPRELFDVLTPQGQKYFEDKVGTLQTDVQSQNNGDTPNIVKRFRSIDRFPHLVMRYIDETEFFKNIRFQVQLGKFRFKFYGKKCINEEEDVRSLQKEINGFGRLQEIEAKRKVKYKDILQPAETRSVKIDDSFELDLIQFAKDTNETTPYITDSRAFYNIHNNRIGLYWDETSANDGKCYPKLGDYIPKLSVNEASKKAEVEMPAPRAMLSVYELPAMIFCQYLLSKNSNDEDLKKLSAEKIIIDKYNNLRQFFTDVSDDSLKPVAEKKELEVLLQDKYSLKLSEIPDKLVEYLSGRKPESQSDRKRSSVRYHLVQRLQRSIRRRDRYEIDRKKIGDKNNKYAKNGYADVRHGALAQYLSKSFIEWQPTKNGGKDKLTGLNFSKLQAELAMFNGEKNKFNAVKKMLSSAKMLDSSIAHPFLNNVVCKPVRNIEELYLVYLKEEIKYLKTFLDIKYKNNIQKDDNIDFEKTELKRNIDVANIPFIHGKVRWEERNDDYYRKLAKRYLELGDKRTAIWLPDGIFTNCIIDILKKRYADNEALMNRLKDDALNNNAAYLINTYFETELKDHSQPFYRSYNIGKNGNVNPNRFARVYDLFNILNNKKVNNSLVAVPMTSDQIKERFKEKVMGLDGKPVVMIGSNKKPVKDIHGKEILKKHIHEEINNYINNMTNRDKGNHKTIDEAKEAMRQRLTRYINDVKDNERAIRRYKTQDMILFLIVGKLMEDTAKNDSFKLSNVCTDSFLSRTVNFEFPMAVNGRTVYISQNDMSLKNYGEFYQLLSDERMPSLLKKLAAAHDSESKMVVDYSKLMGELTSYDLHRTSIFKAVHQLEELVVSDPRFKFLDEPDNERFYINNDKSKMAKRNHFKSLLQLLADSDLGALAEDERDLVLSIRNAFSHNHYDVDFGKIAPQDKLSRATLIHTANDNDKKVQLITIAKLIADKLKELQEQIKSKKTN